MPVDVQWFIYALISNGALSAEDAVAIYNSIGEGCTLESYAQVVLEQMAAGISEEEDSCRKSEGQTQLPEGLNETHIGHILHGKKNKSVCSGTANTRNNGKNNLFPCKLFQSRAHVICFYISII